MLNRRSISHPARKAQAFIELAILLPFLLLMLVAIIDFGFWLYDIIGTQAALRAGALAAVQAAPDGTPLADDSHLRAAIAEAHGPVFPILPSEIFIARTDEDPAFGGAVSSVTLSIRHLHFLVLPVLLTVGPTVTIQATVRAPVVLSR